MMRTMREAACIAPLLLSLHAAVCVAAPASVAPATPFDEAAAARFAALALKCLHDEYPNHLSLTIDGDADLRPPHELTPAFYGCYDWHSDVHGHWLLVRLLHLFPDAPFAPAARAAVARSLTAQNIAGKIAYLKPADRAWMLEGIAHGLAPGDRRIGALLSAAELHRNAALPAVTGEHYEGGHWLGTFAVYLTSGAGMR